MEGGITEVMEANVGDAGLSQFDFDIVKVPSGGGLSWQVPNIDGNIEEVKEITGIMVHWTQARAFYRMEFTGESTPPDCHSDDCIVGIGDPGGSCLTCGYAQFGSDPKSGRGQACNLNRFLFIMRPDTFLPIVVKVPPTSVRIMKQFSTRLTSQKLPFYGVELSLTLKQAQNKSGIKYSEIVPAVKRKLEPEEIKQIAVYVEGVKNSFEKIKSKFNEACM